MNRFESRISLKEEIRVPKELTGPGYNQGIDAPISRCSNYPEEYMLHSKPLKILLGIVTLLPVLYMAYFFAVVFQSFDVPMGTDRFNDIFKLHMAAMLFGFALLVFYVVHLFRAQGIASEMKVLWLLVLFFGNIFAMPVYWFVNVWRAPVHAVQVQP